MTTRIQDGGARLSNLMTQHTIATVKAALSSDPDTEIQTVNIWLGLQNLTGQEREKIYANTTGNLAATLAYLAPTGIARQQLTASIAVATTVTGMQEAFKKLPAPNRTERRGKK